MDAAEALLNTDPKRIPQGMLILHRYGTERAFLSTSGGELVHPVPLCLFSPYSRRVQNIVIAEFVAMPNPWHGYSLPAHVL
jgi:hypothetical protein